MYVTMHAVEQIDARLGHEDADTYVYVLEQMSGQVGRVAYLLADLPYVADEAGSRGDVIVAIAIEGSVETVYFRRHDQDMSAEWFGVDEVIDLREYDDRYESVPEWDTGYEDVPVKGEARAKRLDSRGKMMVSNRSALMLNRLVRDAGNRKRQRRRKRGAK